MPEVTVQSLTPAQRRGSALRSTVVLKAAMAVSGLVMVLFLLVHMYGNLKAFSGRAAFDDYAHHLRTVGEPFLPYAGALWIVRVVLVVSVVIHIGAALILWRRARSATAGRGGWRYESTRARGGVQRSYASFTMRWGGVTAAAFIVYHLLHLSTDIIHPGGASSSPYVRLVNGFQIWWVVASYTVALIAVGFHLRHGFWSAFATLGANTSVRRRRRLNVAAVVVAVVITAGFLIVPYSVLFGWVGR
jgi:succinate dehydrogenase / fumarate reductase cytochrome b subunit